MHLENTILIHGDVGEIFALAAAIENWPAILPHYRKVTFLADTSEGRRARMEAWRGRIPVTWEAVERIDSSVPQIQFTHTKGFTRGMNVVWRFVKIGAASSPITMVTIDHDLPPVAFGLRGWLIDKVVAGVFIDYIATKTLARMKELVELRART